MTVAVRKGSTSEEAYGTLTLCHVFKSCSQDSCAVLAVMSDVLKDLKVVIPQLQSVYYWQDNAGCYHCGNTFTIAQKVGELRCVTVRRIFSVTRKVGKELATDNLHL